MAKKKASLTTTLGSDQVLVRLPDGIRKKLRELAAERGRTMNVEIVAALDAWIGVQGQSGTSSNALDRIEQLVRQNNLMIEQMQSRGQGGVESAAMEKALQAIQEAAAAAFLNKGLVEQAATAMDRGDVDQVLRLAGQMASASKPKADEGEPSG